MTEYAYTYQPSPVRPPAWQEAAVCRSIDPELYFPSDSQWTTENAMAKELCGGCPVQAECLEFALGNNEQYGVWGGLTTVERRQIAKRRAVA